MPPLFKPRGSEKAPLARISAMKPGQSLPPIMGDEPQNNPRLLLVAVSGKGMRPRIMGMNPRASLKDPVFRCKQR